MWLSIKVGVAYQSVGIIYFKQYHIFVEVDLKQDIIAYEYHMSVLYMEVSPYVINEYYYNDLPNTI